MRKTSLAMNKERIIPAFRGFWVVAVMAAYLYQFRRLGRPILELLGLS